MENKSREELIKQMSEELEELKELSILEDMITDNKFEFEFNGETYRVRIPTYRESKEIEEAKIKKHNELVMKKDENGNPVYYFEDELKKILQERGIDIQGLINEIDMKSYQIEDLMLALIREPSESERIKIRNKIIELREEQAELIMKKTEYLAMSIESQVNEFGIIYTLYLVLERKHGDNWIRVFENFDQLQDSDNRALIKIALFYLMQLMNQQ